jgi:competence transcription factor ComK
VQQLYLNPTQQLPVLILYSQENQTGKSTFGLLMQMIFGDNLVPIGNSDLQSDFNSTYSSKLLAVCEETLLERKKEAERIKAISTSPRILVNPKGQAQYQIDFFCKFIFTSNNPRMIYVTRHDTRFWILEVKELKTKVPKFEHVMASEIPAFLHHLQQRKPAAANEGRMYFHDSLLKTSAFEDTVRINEPTAATDLRERITDLFLQDKNLEQIEIPLCDIRQRFFKSGASDAWIREILKDYLRVEQLRDKNTGRLVLKRGTYPIWELDPTGTELVKKEIVFRNRPYVFWREAFVSDESPEDYAEIEKVEAAAARAKLGIFEQVEAAAPADDLPF